MPFFSIVVPTFNRSSSLSIAIKSVQQQTFSDWELIIVDDGSTDNTAKIVSEQFLSDSRIKYIYQHNAERSAARNKGISKAIGDYVCFLDSDDAYSPNHLHNLYSEIVKNDFRKDIYVVKSKILDVNRKEKAIANIISGKNDYETILINTITPGQFCIPKKYLQREKFDEKIRISEDTEILFRFIRLAKLIVVNQYTLEYIQHEDNSVNPLKYNAYAERYKTLKKIFSYPEASYVSKNLRRKVLSDCFFGIQKHYSAKKKYFKARLIMLEALLRYPEIRWKEKVYLLINPN
jgi:glycosyltransferase involved in cell wall biosynthesis